MMGMPFSDMDVDLEMIENMRAAAKYDWVDTQSRDNRSPSQYPYSYSAHYKWREFDKRRSPGPSMVCTPTA